jgi:T-complex protein 1 subunit zeta
LASNKALEDLEAVKVKREIDPDTLIQMARTSLRTKVYQKLALTEV